MTNCDCYASLAVTVAADCDCSFKLLNGCWTAVEEHWCKKKKENPLNQRTTKKCRYTSRPKPTAEKIEEWKKKIQPKNIYSFNSDNTLGEYGVKQTTIHLQKD